MGVLVILGGSEKEKKSLIVLSRKKRFPKIDGKISYVYSIHISISRKKVSKLLPDFSSVDKHPHVALEWWSVLF